MNRTITIPEEQAAPQGVIEVTIKIYPEDLELLQTYHQLSGLKSYGLESDMRIAALAFLQERIYEYRKVEQALRKVEQTLHAATPQPEPLTTPQPEPIPAWQPTTLPEDDQAAAPPQPDPIPAWLLTTLPEDDQAATPPQADPIPAWLLTTLPEDSHAA